MVNKAVLEQLRLMLPSEFTLETALLDTKKFSSRTITEGAHFTFGGEDGDGKYVQFPTSKMLHFLHPDNWPKVRSFSDANDDEDMGMTPDADIYRFYGSEKDELRREGIIGSFFTEKEKEVANFLHGLESRLLLATTREETNSVLDEFIRVTHLPPSVASYFYRKARHRSIERDSSVFVSNALEAVDRNFCYSFGVEYIEEKWKLKRRGNIVAHPYTNFDQELIDGMLVEGAREALRRQRERWKRHKETRTEYILFSGKAIDQSHPRERDFFTDLNYSLEMLMQAKPTLKGCWGSFEEKMDVFLDAKELAKEIVESPLIFTTYSQFYAYCCYQTNDTEGLKKVVGNYVRAIDHNNLLQRDWKSFNQDLFQSLLISWHALKTIERKPDLVLDRQVGKIKDYLGRKLIVNDFLPKIARDNQEPRTIDIDATFSTLMIACILGDSDLDHKIIETVIRGEYKGPFNNILIGDLVGHYFPEAIEREVSYRDFHELTYPHRRLSAEELQHRQTGLIDLLRPLVEPSATESLMSSFVHYRERHQRLANEASADYNLTEARKHNELLGMRDDYQALVLGMLDDLPGLNPRHQANLVESCVDLIKYFDSNFDNWGKGRKSIKEKLEERMIETLANEAVNENVFEQLMITSSRYEIISALNAGALYLHRRGENLFPWFRNYWPTERNEDIHPKAMAALEEEAQAFIEDGGYTSAHLIYRKLDPERGTQRFLAEVYGRRVEKVDERESKTEVMLVGFSGKKKVVNIRSESQRSRRAKRVRKHSLIVEGEKEGRRVIVTKENNDERITELEFRIYNSLQGLGYSVATPLSCSGNLITVEYSGVTLQEHTKNGCNREELSNLLKATTKQRIAISRSLNGILTEEDKKYLQSLELRKVEGHFSGLSRDEIERDFYALRVMKALGIDDDLFKRAYGNIVGDRLIGLPKAWLKDTYAGNVAVDGRKPVDFDFNNIHLDPWQFDDSLLLHSFGLKLKQQELDQQLDYTQSFHQANIIRDYRLGFVLSSVHRNFLHAGYVLDECLEGLPGATLEEAAHYFNWGNYYLDRLEDNHTLLGIRPSDLKYVKRKVHDKYITSKKRIELIRVA